MKSDKTSILDSSIETGVVAILRADRPDQLLAVADAVKAGGEDAIEVTMTTPVRRK